VSLIVDKSDVTTVSLLLQLARLKDSGVYTCKPNNAPEANITLHVLKGNIFENCLLLVSTHTFSGDKTAELSQSTGLIRDGSEFVSLSLTISVIYANIWLWDLKTFQHN
jgi:hypothetical protein